MNNNKIYKHEKCPNLIILRSQKDEQYALRRGEMFVVIRDMMLTKEHPFLAEQSRIFDIDPGETASLYAIAFSDAKAAAREEFDSTGQINGYECLSHNIKCFWISHFDLALMEEVK